MTSVISREYKVMLDHRAFVDREPAVSHFWDEVGEFVRPARVKAKGEFDTTEKRKIVFLDTPDLSVLLNGFVLRQREGEEGTSEYTLKCRSDDRYVAAGADVREADGLKGAPKLEEDIAAPFRSRYSHSNTVSAGKESAPTNLEEAGAVFPALTRLERDGMPCSGDLPLRVVNSVHAFERVLTGPTFDLGDEKAEVALILWSNGAKGRPLVAEFSFRYKDKKERFSAEVSRSAMQLFRLLQRLDWCRPESMTKTEYVYRTKAGD